MNWDAIGAVGEIVGGLVVVATLFYLGRQIRESNKQAKAQTERDFQSQWAGIFDTLLLDPKVRGVVRKGVDSFEALSADEKSVFGLILAQFLNQLEIVLRMERDGLLAPDLADTVKMVTLSLISTPGGREYWKMASEIFSELSTKHINQGLSNPEVVPMTKILPFWSEQASGMAK